MLWTRLFLVVAICMILEHAPVAGQAPDPAAPGAQSRIEVNMEHVGKAYLFDYGDLVVSVKYLSDRRLVWEQIKGPEVGHKAEEEYGYTVIRPAIYFIWWQERDTSVVTQVVDFENGRVFTTWISPEKKVESFQGRVRARDL